ncbi:MAG: threonine/serine dehydratase [Candidatus Eremiobacteraeota bacterium]|nr:threonine/serine dehydratase [Candidatus Eremiobacteraeota bacterium]
MQVSEQIVSRDKISATAELIARHIRRTPLLDVNGDDFGLAVPNLSLKLESLQHSGSFKARGAFANLLLRTVPDAGIVAASGGNHGAAVAFAAMKLGKRARIFVPDISSPAKIERIRRYGADLVVGGERYADAFDASERWRAQSGAMAVHAFDAIETLFGTGTIGAELEEQNAACDTLLVPVGGGGLIAGIASWFSGTVKIVAVESDGAPKLARALEAGHPVDVETGGIAADSLAPRRVGELTFPIARRYVDRVVLVADDAIRAAQRALWNSLTVVAEPGGAAAFAALLSKQYRPRAGERVCVIISGGNSTAVDFNR